MDQYNNAVSAFGAIVIVLSAFNLSFQHTLDVKILIYNRQHTDSRYSL
jgi:hypothetical protein